MCGDGDGDDGGDSASGDGGDGADDSDDHGDGDIRGAGHNSAPTNFSDLTNRETLS